ncbi:hypothetical protein I4U23_019778 [Adineta vaga]|nr:hypothetical protein I4U23_019778 [Adineta vaga]
MNCEDNGICLIKSNTLVSIYISIQVSLYYIISPFLLIIFDLLTVSNIHQQATCLTSFVTSSYVHRREKPLTCMLLLQDGTHLIFALPFGIIYRMNCFQLSTQTLTIIGIRLIFVIWQQCDYFLYILIGSIYRRQFVRLLRSILCLRNMITLNS